ncbi:MAG: hypothetical protein HRF43_11570 [Phycisphaerae bacterium]|jgi:hypothetical protein
MKLDAIVVQPQPGEVESLGLAVRAVAAGAGGTISYDAFEAALGLSLTALARPADPSPAAWSAYGCDAFLEPAARLFGLHVRDLHPPEVGLDMLAAEEFPQHFELSHRPLILRALENGQPVLAWGGWEGEAAPTWGVITAMKSEQFRGVAPHRSGLIRLAGPAAQCYVVEVCEPRRPADEELFAAMIGHARAYLCAGRLAQHGEGRPKPTAGLLTGPAVFEAWLQWLAQQRPESGPSPAREAHCNYARFLSAARLSAARVLDGLEVPHPPARAALVDAIVETCEVLAGELWSARCEDRLVALWRTVDGHEVLREELQAARAAETRIAESVCRLADE